MGEAWQGPETYMPKLINASRESNVEGAPFSAWLSSMNFTENSTSTNTYFVYSFNWQKDGVTWYVNNVPTLKRVDGETVSWKWGDEEKR